MKIVNPAVRSDFAAGVPLRLDLGCGPRPRPGFYGVDRADLPGVDIVADLNEPLTDLPNNSVAEVYTRHTLEHVEKLLDLLTEIHRVDPTRRPSRSARFRISRTLTAIPTRRTCASSACTRFTISAIRPTNRGARCRAFTCRSGSASSGCGSI